MTTVKRIVANLQFDDPAKARIFYEDLLGLDTVMDQGWIITFAADGASPPQVSVATDGGSGTPLPAISIEVDDVDTVYDKAQKSGFEIVYPLSDEPWGVRRFFVRDPTGNIVNILSHA
jgi:predicted enzyme related to lactoylglutathione lyase